MSQEVVLTTLKNGIRIIKMNRPKQKNAMSGEVYEEIANILNDDGKNDSVVLTIITGEGDYYSSGNDLKSVLASAGDISQMEQSRQRVYNLIDAFIQYPKLLIAVVNGPAIGIAVTTLALCDIVYASDRATFETPFLKLGLCPEACSSYTLPLIMGRSRASEMLFLNKRLTAQEAFDCQFVSRIVEHEKLDDFIDGLCAYGKLPVNCVKVTKSLMSSSGYRNVLKEVNGREMDTLAKCVESEEFSNSLMAFFNKSKL